MVEETIGRGVDAVECSCGGYAAEVDCTEDEIKGPLNCGSSWACCVGAFVCVLCGKRTLRSREAPEME